MSVSNGKWNMVPSIRTPEIIANSQQRITQLYKKNSYVTYHSKLVKNTHRVVWFPANVLS